MNIPLQKSILICTTHRSGSFWLSDLLNQTGQLGNFNEYFNYKKSKSHLLEIPRPYSPHFSQTIARGATSNGAFGAKILYPQLGDIERGFHEEGRHLGKKGFEILTCELRNILVIRLRRNNRIRQAISYYRAHYSRRWWKSDDGPNEPFDVDYLGLKHIRAVAIEIERWERSWDALIAASGLPVINVTYENLLKDQEAELVNILGFLGYDPNGSIPSSSKFLIQSDDYSDEAYKCFLEFDEGRTDVMLRRDSSPDAAFIR